MTDHDLERSMDRRTVLSVLGTTGTVLGLGGTGLAVADGSGPTSERRGGTDSWPQFMHDAANTGVNPQASGPKNGVTSRWTDRTDEETSGLVVAPETVYVGGSRVRALAAADGSERWTYDPSSTTFESPTVQADTLYVTADRGGDERNSVVALNADTGDVRWEYTDESAESSVDYDAITAGPATLFVTAQTGFDDWLYAIETETGAKRWTTSIGSPGQVETGTAHVGVAEGTVYVPGAQTLHARDAETGDVEWRAEETDFYNEPDATPAIVDGTVYVGAQAADQESRDQFFAVAASDGGVEWRFDPDGDENGFWHSPAVVNGTVYVSRWLTQSGVLYALDATDGSVEWSVEVSHAMDPAVADGVVYGGDVAFDAETGKELWRTDLDVGKGAVVDDTVYVTGNAVAALIESTGGQDSSPTESTETTTEKGTSTDTGTSADTGTSTDPSQPQQTDTPTEPETMQATAPDTTQATETVTQTADTPPGTDAGAPGLGIIGTLGGLASVAGYYLYRAEDEGDG